MRRRVVVCSALLLLWSLGVAVASGAGRQQAARPFAGTFLVVEPRGGKFAQDQARLDVLFGFASVKRAVGRITLFVPRGFEIGSNALPGTPLGSVSILTAEPFDILSGSIALLPLDQDLRDRAHSCTDREPVSAWVLGIAGPTGRHEVPLYVSPPQPGDPTSAAQRIDLCLAALAPSLDARTPTTLAIAFTFRDFLSPQMAGGYGWHAIVAPLGADRRGLRPAAAYELRATVPLPQRLTLSGRYLAREGMVLLTGSLRTRGRARARVPIELIRLDRVVTKTSAIFRDAPLAVTRTSTTGTYIAKIPSRRTSGFLAYAWPRHRPCSASKIAPGGCLGSSIAGVESDPITVGVP
jgi:hypothetical protein